MYKITYKKFQRRLSRRPLNSRGMRSAAPTIQSLVEAFVTSKQSQRMGDTTVKRHKREFSRLADFLGENGVFVPNAITAAALYKFRETWTQDRLDSFMLPIVSGKKSAA